MIAGTSATLTPDAFAEAVDAMRVFCGMVLLSFAKHGTRLRDTIIRNFIARGMACTQTIHQVWRSGNEPDAWILHRSLLDGLFHLHHLAQTNEFQVFDDYSFIRLFEARERLLSDKEMHDKLPKDLKLSQKSNRRRYDVLRASGTSWHRPKAEEVAKNMGLGFLYRYGYDYASTYVHPMASGGAMDFDRLISPPHKQPHADSTVITNSILVQSLVMQKGLNASSMRWRSIVYDFIDQVRGFLSDGSQDLHTTLLRIGKAWPEFELCEGSRAEHSP